MITKDTKVLITGCGGMLGEAVYKLFKEHATVRATDIDLNEPWLSRLDVSVSDDVNRVLKRFKPDVIVHLAALTDMEYCERHPDHAYAVNEYGVKNFMPYVLEHDIPFVYISTAGIFDGKKDVYTEEDEPAPLSVYGKSKYAGELAARSLPKHIVVRAGWMVGGGPKKDKKFVHKIIKQLQAGKKEIMAVNDKLGAPCYTYDLAKILLYLLNSEQYGLYHGVCDGGGSRFEIAASLVDMLGLDDVVVRQVDSGHFREDYFAPRPASEMLSNAKIKSLQPTLVRDWQICLKDYVGKFDWGL